MEPHSEPSPSDFRHLECNICKAQFADSNSLMEHLQIHADEFFGSDEDSRPASPAKETIVEAPPERPPETQEYLTISPAWTPNSAEISAPFQQQSSLDAMKNVSSNYYVSPLGPNMDSNRFVSPEMRTVHMNISHAEIRPPPPLPQNEHTQGSGFTPVPTNSLSAETDSTKNIIYFDKMAGHYRCEICSIWCDTYGKMLDHLHLEHDILFCSACSYTPSNTRDFVLHLNFSHFRFGAYFCPFCSFTSAVMDVWNKHLHDHAFNVLPIEPIFAQSISTASNEHGPNFAQSSSNPAQSGSNLVQNGSVLAQNSPNFTQHGPNLTGFLPAEREENRFEFHQNVAQSGSNLAQNISVFAQNSPNLTPDFVQNSLNYYQPGSNIPYSNPPPYPGEGSLFLPNSNMTQISSIEQMIQSPSESHLKCEICQQTFDTALNLNRHYLIRQCPACKCCTDESTDQTKRTQKHARIHHFSNGYYHCSKCSFNATNWSLCLLHMRSSHENQSYVQKAKKMLQCMFCSKLVSRSNIYSHEKTTPHPEYKCPACSFSTRANFFEWMEHIQQAHSRNNRFECWKCSYASKKYRTWKFHLENAHRLETTSESNLGQYSDSNVRIEMENGTMFIID